MAKDKTQYFWNKKGECFAGCDFGEEVTKYFEGDEKRCKEYLALGKIATSEPLDFDHAKENELQALRKEVENLQSRNLELEKDAKKSVTSKMKEVKAENAELKKQIEELTNPGK